MTRSKGFVVMVVGLAAVALILGLWLYKRGKTVPDAPIPDPSTIKIDHNYCANNIAECEKLCARCPDKEACFKTGGECGGPPPAVGFFQDRFDRGPDVWWPGCHFDYLQNGCINGGPWVGDQCQSDGVSIKEWFNRVCHNAQGDFYIEDCNALCLRIGLGAGRCVTDIGFCSTAINSAHCQCQNGNPGPTPPGNPS